MSAYLRNGWYAAFWDQDVPAGQPVARTILNEELVFFRKADGTVTAMTDRCPHRFAKLSMGRVAEGDRIVCPYHGLEFGADGRCAFNPHGSGNIPPGARVRAYPVVARHTVLWIWMGDKPADPALIPDYRCLDAADPVRVTKRDYLRMNASCELVMNNLLDTSHTSYLHAGILGTADTVAAETRIEEVDGAVRISRISANSLVPSMYRDLTPADIERTTKWNVIRWSAPSNIMIQGGVGGPGGDPAQGWGYDGVHLLTPETDRTMHYHFCAARWNLITDDVMTNERIRDHISKMRRFAFAEQDAPVIEAQQRAIDAAREPISPVMLSIDAGLMRCHRVLERLRREEAQADAGAEASGQAVLSRAG